MNSSFKNLLLIVIGLSAAGTISLQANSVTFKSDGTTLGAQDDNNTDLTAGMQRAYFFSSN